MKYRNTYHAVSGTHCTGGYNIPSCDMSAAFQNGKPVMIGKDAPQSSDEVCRSNEIIIATSTNQSVPSIKIVDAD